MLKKRQTVFVAMSGGVDSSVAALLLRDAGYEVVGVFMRNWHADVHDGFVGDCPWEQDWHDVEQVCKLIGISCVMWDFSKEYYDEVVEYFFREYAAGRTPNPDVMCNKYVKFGCFFDRAISLGADYVSTGHHVRKGTRKEGKEQYTLREGVDPNKDQSYFLWTIQQEQLSKTLFPVGEYHKDDIRAIAERAGLPTAQKRDSQGICFIGNIDVQEFLRTRLSEKEGDIVTVDGEVVGTHCGVHFYTEGQRRGIDVGGTDEPYYVVEKDMVSNTLVVAEGADHPCLFSRELTAADVHWIAGTASDFPLTCSARIRYRQDPAQTCTVERIDDRLLVTFDQPQRAVAQGQSIVFYSDAVCLGGGVISHRY